MDNKNNEKSKKELITNGFNLKAGFMYSIFNDASKKAFNTAGTIAKDLIMDKFGTAVYFMSYEFEDYNLALKWIYSKDKKKYIKHAKRMYLVNKSVNNARMEPLNPCKYHVQLDKNTFTIVEIRVVEGKDTNAPYFYTQLSFYIFGKRYKKYIRELYTLINKEKVNKKLTLITASGSQNMVYTESAINKRSFDTVFIDEKIKSQLIRFVHNWYKNSKLFENRGITYKAGILLYGEPGTGKTTIARAIATELNAYIIVIDVTMLDKSDMCGFNEIVSGYQNRPKVIVLEEIDCAIINRDIDSKTDTARKEIILNRLLQLLDGINSANNTIFVATTNKYERLDDALIRDGRFDLRLEIGKINRELACKMCKSFNVNPELVIFPDEELINPATLQSRILKTYLNKY